MYLNQYKACFRKIAVKGWAPVFKVLEIDEFVVQLRYYLHLVINTIGKGTNPLFRPIID